MTTPNSGVLEPRNGAVDAAAAGEGIYTTPVTVGRAGRVFMMSEMPALSFAALIDLVVAEAQTWLKEGILNENDLRVQVNDLTALLPLITKLLARAQEFFAKAIVLVFGMDPKKPEDQEAGVYITQNITVRQLSLAIIAFMETNAWEDVVENFFRIGESFQTVTKRFSSGRPTSSPSAPTSSSPDTDQDRSAA